jgi:hypothetical protein
MCSLLKRTLVLNVVLLCRKLLVLQFLLVTSETLLDSVFDLKVKIAPLPDVYQVLMFIEGTLMYLEPRALSISYNILN